jgi:hypothetical protein
MHERSLVSCTTFALLAFSCAQADAVKLICHTHSKHERSNDLSGKPDEVTAVDGDITVDVWRAAKTLYIQSTGLEADFALKAERGEFRHGVMVDLSGTTRWAISWETEDQTHAMDFGRIVIDRTTGQLLYSRTEHFQPSSIIITTTITGACEKADANKRRF